MDLKQYLESIGRLDILNRWDYELNNVSPDKVSVTDKKQYYFKCPRGIHKSELRHVNIFHRGRFKNLDCKACKSFAQKIIDRHGAEYLSEIWDEKEFSPWDYGAESKKEAHFKCTNGHHYIRPLVTKGKLDYKCPYCTNRAKDIVVENSVGFIHPKILGVWSIKNDKTPYQYSPQSGEHAWFKCENHVHDDYFRQIASSVNKSFKCPYCVHEYLNTHRPVGSDAYNWQGGITNKNKLERTSAKYKEFREKMFARDNYTCQCCLRKGGKLNMHHIQNFSSDVDGRYDESNVITLCEDCHSISSKDSFHNIYGVRNNTPEQLEEYINQKRKQLGIPIQ